jgi:prepilin-type N-terminal cleavage/methylation domain-containing protein
MFYRHNPRAAFTLVEMLVVIAIMAILALALFPAIRAARDHGDYARCQTRLRNLHQACLNHLADHNSYPRAGSYELYSQRYKTYSEARGWVAWIRKDGNDDLHPWADDNTESHADDYLHTRWSGQQAERAIRTGTLFKYTGEDLTTYLCPSFERKHRKLAGDARRSFAMNYWFGARRMANWDPRYLNSFNNKEASRMGLFIEIDKPSDPKSASAAVGEPGNEPASKRKVLPDDSAWDWDDGEAYGAAYHRKAGKKHGHVIFVDGHVESLPEGVEIADNTLEIGEGTH